MCKIHDTAFDANIIEVRPECVLRTRKDVLDEIDGPALTPALQVLRGASIHNR